MKVYDEVSVESLLGMLSQGRYATVIRQAKEVMYSPELEEIERSYDLLCHFYKENVEDPERQQIYFKLGQRLHALLSRALFDLLRREDRYTPYAYKCRALELRKSRHGLSLSGTMALLSTYEKEEMGHDEEYFTALENLFDLLWCAPYLSEEEHDELNQWILECGDSRVMRVAMGGLFLANTTLFDPRKVALLLTGADHDSASVSLSALSALLLLLGAHPSDMDLFPALQKRLRELYVKTSQEKLRQVLEAIYTTYATEETDRLYREKIMPEIQNLMARYNVPSMNAKDLMAKIQEAQNVEDVHELEQLVTNIQSEIPRDRDILYHGIVDLKRHSFFEEPSRWFLPFDSSHPLLSRENTDVFIGLFPLAFHDTFVCSSDLYSYAFVPYWRELAKSLPTMPESGNSFPLSLPNGEEDAARDFTFSAYRYFYLFRTPTSIINPFQKRPLLVDTYGLMERVGGDWVSSKLYGLRAYRELNELHQWLSKSSSEKNLGPLSWRRLAVAAAKEGVYDLALEALLQVLKQEEDPPLDIILRISELYAREEAYEKALEWLSKIDDKTTDDWRYAYQKGMVLGHMGHQEDALELFFKAYFLSDGQKPKVVKHLAEMLLALGRASDVLNRLSKDLSGKDREEEVLLGKAYIAKRDFFEGLSRLQGHLGEQELEAFIALLIGKYEFQPWEKSLLIDLMSYA